ncbi:MAG: S-methyl-5-thioribose-1-phosphate isomerase [Firmicutes bacterium]|nr:S-methyl-5-thioribose-1-phosphate isomerase [Bacillota bacterium]
MEEFVEKNCDAFDVTPVRFIKETDTLLILDQTKLPGEEVYIEMETKEDVWDAIYQLKVRGAPAIGVAAAYGLYVVGRNLAREFERELMIQKLAERQEDLLLVDRFMERLQRAADYLVSARPTAVNLSWALNRMMKAAKSFFVQAEIDAEWAQVTGRMDEQQQVEEESKLTLVFACCQHLLNEAENIRIDDELACRAMGEYGLGLLKPGMGILTHCNAGTIATAKYGTCLAPIHLGQQQGYDFHVFADETRPLLQGARLTAWELKRAGVDVTLICDNMASIVMKKGWIDAVVVGCDRMAANGDGANKIGTSGVAILAKEYGIPFYMFVPTSTIDLGTATGDDIVIEERKGEEIYQMWYERDMAPSGVKTYNPAFDVTDHSYITAVITEKGIVRPPYDANLKKLFEK